MFGWLGRGQKSRPFLGFALGLCLAGTLASGCSKFKPNTAASSQFLPRVQTQAEGPLTVSVAVLGPKESQEYFGVKLAKKGVQPVWLKIRNDTKYPNWLLPISTDPEYFSPNEAAYRFHMGKSREEEQKMDLFFNEQQVPFSIPPGSAIEGFLYTNLERGAKEVSVELLGNKQLKRFVFVAPVPGLKADYQQVDFDRLYPPGAIREADLTELRRALEQYPCCTKDKKGKKEGKGDAVNLVVVGDDEDLITAFIRRGWRETAVQTKRSSLKMFKHLLFGGRYDNAPMSKLWLFDRGQDISFQKPRRSIHQRNHLRLWMTPLRYQGKHVWIGTISRDIGLRSTWTPPFVTHKIDSQIDEAREFVLQDLLASEAVGSFGHVKGVGKSDHEHTMKNLIGDEWYTDGLRVVIILTEYPTSLLEAKPLGWETPPHD